MTKTAGKTCEIIKTTTGKKQAGLWIVELKTEVKKKKSIWENNGVKTNIQLSGSRKKSTWTGFGKKMQIDCHRNQKLFYNVLKTSRESK